MSFDPKIKEHIIQEMCRTMRHDYDLEYKSTKGLYRSADGEFEEDEYVIQGLNPVQKRALYNQMKQVFEHCFEKYFSVEIDW